METNFNFKSQICTSIEQSRRLLELGLKKETADCHWEDEAYFDDYEDWNAYVGSPKHSKHIPAWSLHRLLLLLLDNRCVAYDHISFSIDETDVFTKIINHIEWLIKEGYFNKEYLV